MSRDSSSYCDHRTLSFESSAHAAKVGYRRPTTQQRAAATNVNPGSKTKRKEVEEPEALTSFPAPLLLPGDDLSLDPRYPTQSVRAWLRLKDRNQVTSQRHVIYVAAPPDVEPDVEFIRKWSHTQQERDEVPIAVPQVQAVVDYLTAFYHGMPVRLLPYPKLCFSSWDSGGSKAASKAKAGSTRTAPRYIGLNSATECVRIRTRASPDGVFARQLNLDDLLDAAISMLPEDAYALLLLVQHDLFEDVDDEFVCGRAYGGSRVAVISTARYHPLLDERQNMGRLHPWPASHCDTYLQACCSAASQSVAPPTKKPRVQSTDIEPPNSQLSPLSAPRLTAGNETALPPLQAALSAHKALPSLSSSTSAAALSGLWLSRICRTASHELCHCFGMDHCVYYACVMQGSASLAEDVRQPPYLCPVDLAKLLRATGADAEQRYRALRALCEQYSDVHMFSAFAAWIQGRLLEMKER